MTYDIFKDGKNLYSAMPKDRALVYLENARKEFNGFSRFYGVKGDFFLTLWQGVNGAVTGYQMRRSTP